MGGGMVSSYPKFSQLWHLILNLKPLQTQTQHHHHYHHHHHHHHHHGGGSSVVEYLEKLGIGKQAIKRACKMDFSWATRTSPQHFENVVNFFLRYGLSKKDLETLLHKAPLIFTSGSLEKLERRVSDLKQRLNVGEKAVKKIIRRCPTLLSLNYEHNLLPKIMFLESIGFDRVGLGKLISSFPDVLSCSLEHNLKPKVEFFASLGMERASIAAMLRRCPPVAGCSVERNVKPTIRFLESVGMEKTGIVRLLNRCPSVICLSIEKKLRPTVGFLRDAGMTNEEIGKQLTRRPSILGRSIKGCLTDRLNFLTKLGFGVQSNKPVQALGEISSVSLETLQSKVDHLMQFGFSEDEVSKLVRSQPGILKRCKSDISMKMRFYLDILKLLPLDVVKNPNFLLYSLEKRIKPRLRLIAWLHERGIVRNYKFSTLVRMSRQEFSDRFLGLHPQAHCIFCQKDSL